MARFGSIGNKQFTSIGRSGIAIINYVFSSNTTQTTINPAALTGYKAGKTRLTITVNSGIYVYSTDTTVAGLTISGFASGDTITLVNNGFIIGKGGAGGNANPLTVGTAPGFNGGPAMSLGYNISLTNNSYIAGGGGGGGGVYGGGGGGAGGGQGGNNLGVEYPVQPGGAGGAPGLAGANGVATSAGNFQRSCSGGGGGRILPGVGGAALFGSDSIVSAGNGSPGSGGGGGRGGGAGGGGGPDWFRSPSDGTDEFSYSSAGGSANNAAANTQFNTYSAGGAGGGGWGAAGGTSPKGVGGSGGRAIALNGYSVTYVANGTIYGAVS